MPGIFVFYSRRCFEITTEQNTLEPEVTTLLKVSFNELEYLEPVATETSFRQLKGDLRETSSRENRNRDHYIRD